MPGRVTSVRLWGKMVPILDFNFPFAFFANGGSPKIVMVETIVTSLHLEKWIKALKAFAGEYQRYAILIFRQYVWGIVFGIAPPQRDFRIKAEMK
jgi:hypothetical protein